MNICDKINNNFFFMIVIVSALRISFYMNQASSQTKIIGEAIVKMVDQNPFLKSSAIIPKFRNPNCEVCI